MTNQSRADQSSPERVALPGDWRDQAARAMEPRVGSDSYQRIVSLIESWFALRLASPEGVSDD
jgi:hypothetical protein